jgi:hypothetical protein
MGHSASPNQFMLRGSNKLRVRVSFALLVSAAVGCGSDATGDANAATQTGVTAAPPAAGASGAAPAMPSAGTQATVGVQPGATGPTAATGAMGPAAAAGTAAPAANAAGASAMIPSMAAAGAGGDAHGGEHAGMSHDNGCLLKHSVDARDEMLTGEPLVWEGGTGKDLLVPQIVLDWMGENEFESAHDGWHLVRKWDQSCLQSNASASSCRAAQRLQMQGLERAPIQQGGKGDGLAFMAMHRHMIIMLKETFPKHTTLFDGFKKVPRTSDDPENVATWHRISWSSENIRGFDILENIEQNVDMFADEDELGNYIENTYRWTEQTPMQPTNQPGSGLHGALHAQWAVNGSPGNLIEQAVDVRNHLFWKLHGWIDDVWERYRVAKGLTAEDADYKKIMLDQCNEMFYLKKSNRNMPMQPTGSTGMTGATGSAESGFFATQVRPFMDSSCGGCHSAIGPSAGLTLGGTGITSAEVMESLVGKKSTNGEYNLIEPGAPERSWVYLKASGDSATVMCTSSCGRQKMPPSGDGLTAAQLQALSKWITDGASIQ